MGEVGDSWETGNWSGELKIGDSWEVGDSWDLTEWVSDSNKVGDPRYLQAVNASHASSSSSSSSNATSTANMTKTTVAATSTVTCPPCVGRPQVMTTFTSTLSLTSASDLESLNFVAMKEALATEQNWQDATVEVVVVVKVKVQFTFSAVITETQCKAAVASAQGISVSKVSCMAGGNVSSASNASRRLQAAMDVEISYNNQSKAVEAVSISQADMMAGLTTALAADSTVTRTITATGAADPVVTIELEFRVTADEAVAAPPQESMQIAVVSTATSATAITVEATVSAAVVSYTRMPCSEGRVCRTGFQLLPTAETLGCAAAACTAADTDTCCTRLVTSHARSMTVLNSFLLLLLWNVF